MCMLLQCYPSEWYIIHDFSVQAALKTFFMLTECEDDEAVIHNASGPDIGQTESRSQSSHEHTADGEDEQDEPSKSKIAKAGLRIKLSLKPLRKSSRERKVRVNAFIL